MLIVSKGIKMWFSGLICAVKAALAQESQNNLISLLPSKYIRKNNSVKVTKNTEATFVSAVLLHLICKGRSANIYDEIIEILLLLVRINEIK